MPRSKSVLKRERQSEKRRQRNQAVRSALKTYEKRARTSLGTDAAAEDLKALQSRLGKAVGAGVIHPNKAARKMSRLAKQAVKAQAAK